MFKTPLFFNFHHHHFAPKDGCLQDFSSYLLFEATGDSEADDASSADPGGSSAAPEFNDAESCTDDTPDHDECVMDEDEEDEEEEEEENCEKNDEVVESKAIGFTKSSASIDSTKELKMLNEVDKNRLFWEACLAS